MGKVVSAGLIIADTPNSAIATSSKSWAQLLNAEVIYATNFWKPKILVREIEKRNPSWMLFSWRQALYDLIATGSHYEILRCLESRTVALSIPDHLAEISPKMAEMERLLFDYVDCCTVTSPKLFEIYSNKYPDTPCRILFDKPNCELLERTENSGSHRLFDLIWVGNSDWGSGLGIQDHKGFRKYVLPLVQSLVSTNPDLTVKLVDRSNGLISQSKVFSLIAKSKFLVQFSSSEGTGFPLLEATALGAIPISTNVGVAEVVLEEFSSQLLVETIQEAESIINAGWKPKLAEELLKKFKKHIARSDESISKFAEWVLTIKNSSKFKVRECRLSLGSRKLIELFWLIRYLRSR